MSDENRVPNLRKCPFCGGLAYMDGFDSYNNTFYFAKCGRCKAQGHPDKDYETAIMCWNVREEKAND